jgi:hypothetical protein
MMDHINVEGQGGTFAAYIARPKTSPAPMLRLPSSWMSALMACIFRMTGWPASWPLMRIALSITRDLEAKVEDVLRQTAA